jgi:DNA polymerase III epsilon subunit-like protein
MTNKTVVIDIETGGLDDSSDSILTLGAAILSEGMVEESFHIHILEDPLCVNPDALRVNGLTVDILQEHGKSPSFAVAAFEQFLHDHGVFGKVQLAGHNIAAFDMGFMKRLYRVAGRRWFPFDYHAIDTMSAAIILKRAGVLPVPNVKLDTLCDYFGIVIREPGGAHNAAEDAIATAKLLAKFDAMFAPLVGGMTVPAGSLDVAKLYSRPGRVFVLPGPSPTGEEPSETLPA